MRAREIRQEPIVPAMDGQPPGFVVVCLDCGFSTDAHGAAADDAVRSVAPRHQGSHRLTAQPQNLTRHPLYR